MSAAITLGSFDGVHVGHRAVVEALLRRASAASLPAALVTFAPHPREVVGGGPGPLLLTPGAEKTALLAGLGLDRVYVLRFTARLARVGARRFVRDVLVGRLGCEVLVVGEDHRFGHGREGGVAELSALAAELGLELEVVPPVLVDGRPASSTRTREAVAAGDLPLAARLLGRPYGAFAPVVRGAGRGRALGFPTVNLALDPRKHMPPEGIYACHAWVEGRSLAAAMHWGGRPTFGESRPVLEAHLLGHGGELYGRWVELAFLQRIRDVARFEGADELARAMEEDVRRVAELTGVGVALQSREVQ